ncbi:hypothetical protein C2G38_2090687, partial [Gigaspora rosea]
MPLVSLCHLGLLELVVISLMEFRHWASCGITSWFFVGELVASFVTSSVFF